MTYLKEMQQIRVTVKTKHNTIDMSIVVVRQDRTTKALEAWKCVVMHVHSYQLKHDTKLGEFIKRLTTGVEPRVTIYLDDDGWYIHRHTQLNIVGVY